MNAIEGLTHCVIDADYNNHFVYIKTVKFLNQFYHSRNHVKHLHASVTCNTYCKVSKHELQVRLIKSNVLNNKFCHNLVGCKFCHNLI